MGRPAYSLVCMCTGCANRPSHCERTCTFDLKNFIYFLSTISLAAITFIKLITPNSKQCILGPVVFFNEKEYVDV